MIRLLRLLLGLVALIVIVAFAIANRTPVDVSFAPLPITIELPVYGAFLFGLIVGVLVGGLGVWLGGLGKRRQARKMRSQVWALETQLKRQREQAGTGRAAPYGAQKAVALQGSGD
jgi:uncharacterized integral membrane protein